jgi:cytochrome P450
MPGMARTTLASVPSAVLLREIRRREARLRRLNKARQRIASELEDLDWQIRTIDRRPLPRVYRDGERLPSILSRVVGTEPMSAASILAAVKAAGYETTSSYASKMIYHALSDSRKFRRLRRGVYVAVRSTARQCNSRREAIEPLGIRPAIDWVCRYLVDK